MGADGGTVPTRAELIKKKRKEERLDAVGRARLRLNFCALSGHPLAKSTANIVCDSHGNLFNLETILEYMVDAKKKQLLKSEFGIRKMKDLIKIQAEMNKEYIDAVESGETFMAPFMCPFTGHASNGVIKFVALQTCGHVMSQRAIKEMAEQQQIVQQSGKAETSSSSSATPSATTDGASSAESTKPSLTTDKRQCLVCHKPYNPLTDLVELASDLHASQTQSNGDMDRKTKKRAYDQQIESNATTSTASQNPPDAKRAKLS